MITLHHAILTLDPKIVTVRGDIAYDSNEQEVLYDKSAVEAEISKGNS